MSANVSSSVSSELARSTTSHDEADDGGATALQRSFITFLAKFYYFSRKVLLLFLQTFIIFLAKLYHFSCKFLSLFLQSCFTFLSPTYSGHPSALLPNFFLWKWHCSRVSSSNCTEIFFSKLPDFCPTSQLPPPPPPLTNLSCNFLTFTNFVFDQLFLSDRCCIVRSRCGCWSRLGQRFSGFLRCRWRIHATEEHWRDFVLKFAVRCQLSINLVPEMIKIQDTHN